MFHLIIFVGVWVGFAIFGFTQKWSATVSIGGGFFVTCAGLAILITVFGESEIQTESSTVEIAQHQPSIKQPVSKPSNKHNLLVGDWFCENSHNYIHKVVYNSDGTYKSYEAGYVKGVPGETELNHVGTYKIDGDILRTKYKSVKYGGESNSSKMIKKLTSDELVIFYQGINSYEPCHRAIK